MLLLAVYSASPSIDRGPRLQRRIPFHHPVETISAPKGCLTFKSEAQTRDEAVSHSILHHLPATTRGRLKLSIATPFRHWTAIQ